MSEPKTVAAEFKSAKLWDNCIEHSLVRTGKGILIGGLSAFLLFRSPVSRAFVTAFAGGLGAGVSYMDCRLAFEQPGYKLQKLPPFDLSKVAKSAEAQVAEKQ